MGYFLFLKRLRVTSNASRNVLKLTSTYFDKSTLRKLTSAKKSIAGKGLNGRSIIRTKGSISKKHRLFNVAYNFRLLYPSLVSTFKLVPYSNKLLTLMVLPSGGLYYLPGLSKQKLFKVASFKYFGGDFWSRKIEPTYTLIALVKLFKKISNFELWPRKGIQYARSAGSWGKVVRRDFESHTALVYLPSGVRKIISTFSVALPSRCAAMDKRLLKNTKGGFYKSFGKKSIVRGVAMNPIDHPHGGRTKAIRYPRTPWGKTTKFK